MSNFSIGISGLQAAQKALSITGNNLANAATPGYHRQQINFTPAYSTIGRSTIIGGGVESSSVTRMVDDLLEKELLRQNSSLAQVSQERDVLSTLETAFGELSSTGGLNEAIDDFFNAFAELANHTDEIVWQTQVVTDAETLASQFRTLGGFLEDFDTQIQLEAEEYIEQANIIINQIAQLNDDIEKIELQGTKANNLRDERDQLISELSEIIGVSVVERDNGVIDVEAGGIAVVIGTMATELETGIMDDGSLGLSVKGAVNFTNSVSGGKLGGLMNLKNTVLTDVSQDLDDLALTLIRQVNSLQVQGLGSYGSFTGLDGWPLTDEVLANFEPPITDGKIYIRVTDTATSTISRHEIDLAGITPSDPAVGLTVSDVADEINTITGLNCWYDALGLHIEQSAANYEFDFSPAVLSVPTASTLTGASVPSITVSGIYEGSQNDTFTFEVSGAGEVGNGTLSLTVKDETGQIIKTLNIGEGYAAGDTLSIGNGINISVGVGDFGASDSFEVDAFVNTDTSGLLAATGMNCFFGGSGALDITVCSEIAEDPTRVATSLGADGTDNYNVLRISELVDEPISDLGNMSMGTFYRNLVTDIGREISVRQMQQENLEVIVQNLTNQRDEISGVDINEEAVQLLVYEQMFQAMAQYLSTVRETMDNLMIIL
jgi:flagellar hook-associated protein 1 FlgK